MDQFKSGKVVFYKPEKKFGFVQTAEQEKHFFHLSQGGLTRCSKQGDISFIALLERYVLSNPPVVGDELLFFSQTCLKGYKTGYWFKCPQGELREKLFSKSTTYRMRQYYHVPGTEYNEERARCEWESNDILAISVSNPQIASENFSCGDFDTHTWFEMSTADGWQKTADPRVAFFKTIRRHGSEREEYMF